MTEVTAKYKLFLAVGMAVTGTLNTISTKERFQFNFLHSDWSKIGCSHLEISPPSWKQNKSLGNITNPWSFSAYSKPLTTYLN